MIELVIVFIANYGLIVLLPVFILCTSVIKYRRRYRKPSHKDSSLLMAYYLDTARMVSVTKGTFSNGSMYNILATPGGTLFYLVQLPFRSKTNILAIPTTKEMSQLRPDGPRSNMERATLEGDYNNYFSLFVSKGHQAIVRYVLDPKAMAYTIDFCKTHNWEIIDDELCVVSTAASDEIFSLSEIEKFIDEIRPKVETKSTFHKNRNKLSYGSLEFITAHCPICQKELQKENAWFTCPRQHGCLMTGRTLSDIRHKTIQPPVFESQKKKSTHQTIMCPVCTRGMEKTNYAGSGTIIDTCTNCMFRWLDADEATTIILN